MYILTALYPLCGGRFTASAFCKKSDFAFCSRSCNSSACCRQAELEPVARVSIRWENVLLNAFSKNPRPRQQGQLDSFLSVYLQYFAVRKQNNSTYWQIINKTLTDFFFYMAAVMNKMLIKKV